MIEKDLIVIGGGPAGLTAGIYGKRAELDLVVLDSGVGGGQIANAGLVENYPGFPDGIWGMELSETFREHAKNAGVEIRVLESAKEVKIEGKLLNVKTDKDLYQSRAVIVATGQVYKKIGVPGEKELAGKGVSYCATCDGPFFKGRDVAVVGGGTGAAMAALNLADLARKIYVVTKKDSLRVAEKIIETRFKRSENITLVKNSGVKSIIGKEKVSGLKIKIDGKEKILEVDGVIVEVGKKPKTSFLDSLSLELNKGYIVTDNRQMSTVPGLFAAGDVVSGSVKQVSVAVAQGTVAALAAYDYIKNNF